MMSESQTSVQLPLLDISQPIEASSLSSLSQASKEWGYFHITNHGISNDLYNNLISLSKNLFSLPLDTKLKLGPSSLIKSYTPHFIASPFFESLRVSGPDFYTSAKSSAEVLFDDTHSKFCDILKEYGGKMMELSTKIEEVLLMILFDGPDKKFCESEFKNCHGYLRINNYSPLECVEDEETEGLGMHTDMSCITILYQDEIGGLQVRSKEGNWTNINPCEGTLVVNVGDLLQAWSNGRFRSSEHRVILKKPVNRLSVAFFWCFEDEKVILAPKEVLGEGNSRIYKPFICSEYMKFRENSEKGRFDKVGFTINNFAGIAPSNSITELSDCG